MNDIEIDVLAKKQHQRTLEDTMIVIKEYFRELDSNRLKPIYPADIPDKLIQRVRGITPRLP